MAPRTSKTSTKAVTKEEATEVVEKVEETVIPEAPTEPEKVVEEPKVVEKKTVKKIDPEDIIECRSITAGTLLMIGKKTGVQYKWSNMGDIGYVEYQDLLSTMVSNSPTVFRPRIVIENEDVLADPKWKRVSDLYKTMYGKDDLNKLLSLTNVAFEREIKKIPRGLLESLKSEVATRVGNGTFDSIQKIRTIDKVCGTDFERILIEQ